MAIISSETRSRWPGSRSVPDPLLYGAESLGNPKTAPDSPQSSSVVYSEDIPLMPDEAVSDAPWIAFLTVVHDQGGHYRKRSSAAAAYGGFSDVYQCDARFADGSRVVVRHKSIISASDILSDFSIEPGGSQKPSCRQTSVGIRRGSKGQEHAGGKSRPQFTGLNLNNYSVALAFEEGAPSLDAPSA